MTPNDFEQLVTINKVRAGHGAGTTHKVRDVPFWAQFAINAIDGIPIKALIPKPGFEEALKRAIAGDKEVRDAAKQGLLTPSTAPKANAPKPSAPGTGGAATPPRAGTSAPDSQARSAKPGAAVPNLGQRYESEITALDQANKLPMGKARRLGMRIAAAYHLGTIDANEYNASITRLHAVIADAKAERRTDSLSDAIYQGERLGLRDSEVPKTLLPVDYKSSRAALRNAKMRADMDLVGKDLHSLFRRGKLSSEEYDELHSMWMDRRQKTLADIYADDIDNSRTINELDMLGAAFFDLMENRAISQSEYQSLHELYMQKREDIKNGVKRSEERGPSRETTPFQEGGSTKETTDEESDSASEREPATESTPPAPTPRRETETEQPRRDTEPVTTQEATTTEEIPTPEETFDWDNTEADESRIAEYYDAVESADWTDQELANKILNRLTSDYELGLVDDDEYETFEREFLNKKRAGAAQATNDAFWDRETTVFEVDQSGAARVSELMDERINSLNRKGLDDAITALQNKSEDGNILPARQQQFLDKAIARRSTLDADKRSEYGQILGESSRNVPELNLMRQRLVRDSEVNDDLKAALLQDFDNQIAVSQTRAAIQAADNPERVYTLMSEAHEYGMGEDYLKELRAETNLRIREFNQHDPRINIRREPRDIGAAIYGAGQRQRRLDDFKGRIDGLRIARESIPLRREIDAAFQDGQLDISQRNEAIRGLNARKNSLVRRRREVVGQLRSDTIATQPTATERNAPRPSGAEQVAPQPTATRPTLDVDSSSRVAQFRDSISRVSTRRGFFREGLAIDEDRANRKITPQEAGALHAALNSKANEIGLQRVTSLDKYLTLANNSRDYNRLAQVHKNVVKARDNGELEDSAVHDILRTMGAKFRMFKRSDPNNNEIEDLRKSLQRSIVESQEKRMLNIRGLRDLSQAKFDLEVAKHDGVLTDRMYGIVKKRLDNRWQEMASGTGNTSETTPRLQPRTNSRFTTSPTASPLSTRDEAQVKQATNTLSSLYPDYDWNQNVDFGSMPRQYESVAAGMFKPDAGDRGVVYLSDGRSRDLEANSVIFHELGHAFDWSTGTSGRYESDSNSPEMEDFKRAVRNSDYYKKLNRLAQTAPLAEDREHYKYLLRPNEIFARMFSQNIARNSNDPKLIREVDGHLNRDSRAAAHMVPWSDFEGIGQSLDRLMEQRMRTSREQNNAAANSSQRSAFSLTVQTGESADIQEWRREMQRDRVANRYSETTNLDDLVTLREENHQAYRAGTITANEYEDNARNIGARHEEIRGMYNSTAQRYMDATTSEELEALLSDVENTPELSDNFDLEEWEVVSRSLINGDALIAVNESDGLVNESNSHVYLLAMEQIRNLGDDDIFLDEYQTIFRDGLTREQREEVLQYYALKRKGLDDPDAMTDDQREVLGTQEDNLQRVDEILADIENGENSSETDWVIPLKDEIDEAVDVGYITPSQYVQLDEQLLANAEQIDLPTDQWWLGSTVNTTNATNITDDIYNGLALDYVRDDLVNMDLTRKQREFLAEMLNLAELESEGRLTSDERLAWTKFTKAVAEYQEIQGEIEYAQTLGDIQKLATRINEGLDYDELVDFQGQQLRKDLQTRRNEIGVREVGPSYGTETMGSWGDVPPEPIDDGNGNAYNQDEIDIRKAEFEEAVRQEFMVGLERYAEVTGEEAYVYVNYQPEEKIIRVDIKGDGLKMEREIWVDAKSVKHDLFELDEELQGQGIATAVNNFMFDVYAQNGIESISLYANIDVGAFSWSRQGFDWDPMHYTTTTLGNVVNERLNAVTKRMTVVDREDFSSDADYEVQLAYIERDGQMPVSTAQFDAVNDEVEALRNRATGLTSGPRGNLVIPDSYPSPADIAQIGREATYFDADNRELWPGKVSLLGEGNSWYGRKYLTGRGRGDEDGGTQSLEAEPDEKPEPEAIGKWGALPALAGPDDYDQVVEDFTSNARKDFEDALAPLRDMAGVDTPLSIDYNPRVNELIVKLPFSNGIIFERRFDFDTMSVEHYEFRLPEDLQGNGLATAINNHMFDVYKELGMKNVNLNANSDVGGFSWSRAGFDWNIDVYDEHSLDYQVKSLLDDVVDSVKVIDPANYTATSSYRRAVKKALTNNKIPLTQAQADEVWAEVGQLKRNATGLTYDYDTNTVNIPDNYPTPSEISQIGQQFAQLDSDGRDTWVGKNILLGSQWHGQLNLEDGPRTREPVLLRRVDTSEPAFSLLIGATTTHTPEHDNKNLDDILSRDFDEVHDYLESMPTGSRITLRSDTNDGATVYTKSGDYEFSTPDGDTLYVTDMVGLYVDDDQLQITVNEPEPTTNKAFTREHVGKSLIEVTGTNEGEIAEFLFNAGVGTKLTSDNGEGARNTFTLVRPNVWIRELSNGPGRNYNNTSFGGFTTNELAKEMSIDWRRDYLSLNGTINITEVSERTEPLTEMERASQFKIDEHPRVVEAMDEVKKFRDDNLEELRNLLGDGENKKFGIKEGDAEEIARLEAYIEEFVVQTNNITAFIYGSPPPEALEDDGSFVDSFGDYKPRARQVLSSYGIASYDTVNRTRLRANFAARSSEAARRARELDAARAPMDLNDDGTLGADTQRGLDLVKELGNKIHGVNDVRQEVYDEWRVATSNAYGDFTEKEFLPVDRRNTVSNAYNSAVNNMRSDELFRILNPAQRDMYQNQYLNMVSQFRDVGERDDVKLGMNIDDEVVNKEETAGRLRQAIAYLPTDWIRQQDKVSVIRAEFKNGVQRASSVQTSRIIKMEDNSPVSTYLHEMTHQMENVHQQIKGLEWAFWYSRSAVPDANGQLKLPNPRPMTEKDPQHYERERYIEDEWRNYYIGAHYGGSPTSAYELMTMGMEELTGNASRGIFHNDNEYRDFVMGVVASA